MYPGSVARGRLASRVLVMNQELAEVSPTGGARRYVLWGVLVVIAAVVGGIFWWASSDRAVVMEDDLVASLDAALGARSGESWCRGGCSGTGHEWHNQGALADVAELVAESARSIGAETSIEAGDPGTMLVNVERGSAAVAVAVTDSTWVNASPDASGVAVWFTSVRAFDQGAFRGPA